MSVISKSMVDNARRYWKSWLFLGLIILFVGFVRIRLLEIPLERDEGEYAYMGQLILQGIPPYGEAYNMKFPGTYLMYAVIMAVFGQTIEGIHIGLLIVNCAAIVLMYLLARKMVEDFSAVIAAGTYAFLSLSSSVLGFVAHATHFVVLTALAGTLLLLRALDKEKLLLFFLSGILLGCSVIMKQPGLFFVLFGGTYILWSYFFSRRAGLPVFQLGIFSVGALLPLVLMLLWLYAAGVFDRFWFWTIVYASKYATQVSLPVAFLRLWKSFLLVSDGFIPLWILAALGFVAVFINKGFKTTGNYKVFVLLFALFSFLSVLPGFYFRAHYYVTLLPAVSLLVGIFIQFLTTVRFTFFKPQFLKLMGAAIFIAAAAVGVIKEKDVLFTNDPVRLSRLLYWGNPFPESVTIGRFIEERTGPNDRTAIFGSEPQIFFYANRRSATGYIYTYSLMEIHPYALAMQKEMTVEVEASKPKFIINVTAGFSWFQQEKSETYIFRWRDDYIAANYDLVGIVDLISPDLSVYKWYDDAKNYKNQSPLRRSVLIYERRQDV